MTSPNELAEGTDGWWKSVEVCRGDAIFVIGTGEVGKSLKELVCDLGVYGCGDAVFYPHIACIEAFLPAARRRNDNVSANEFAPVHVVAKGR